MKILFLDIDGVLNSFKRIKENHPFDDVQGMEQAPVRLLVDILNKTDCKIVVSSTWRTSGIGSGSDYSNELFVLDPSNTIINATIGSVPYHVDAYRPNEIQAWIDDNVIDKFVIVDDEPYMGHLTKYLIHTQEPYGMLKKHADKIIDILYREINYDFK